MSAYSANVAALAERFQCPIPLAAAICEGSTPFLKALKVLGPSRIQLSAGLWEASLTLWLLNGRRASVEDILQAAEKIKALRKARN